MMGSKVFRAALVLLTLRCSLAALVSEADEHTGNCFLMFSEPLAAPPFPEEGIAQMRKHFLANMNVDSTGHVVASRGEVPAQHDCCPGGYKFDWVRDSALSMAVLQDLAGSEMGTTGGDSKISGATVHNIMVAYAGWVEQLQSLSKDDVNPVDVFGEPKWDMETGRPYESIWCRPQTDGPGLRAKALMMFASGGLAKADLTPKLWTLIKFDLDWLAGGAALNMSTCDLWEESRGHDFLWNRLTMRQALLMGEPMARAMGDVDRAKAYRDAAHKIIGNPFKTHLKTVGGNRFITECSTEFGKECRNFGKDIDGGVILALVHSGWEKNFGSLEAATSPVDTVVAETVQAFNLGFCSIFPVNQQDTSIGIPGVLYGRYSLDKYGGGNPWHITTAALATLFYQAAQVVARGTTLSVEGLLAWRAALASQHFRGTAKEFLAAGDSVLSRLRHHMHKDDNWHMFEQLDKYTGKQYNAQDFTWSYAEVFGALIARTTAMNLVVHPVVLHGPAFGQPGPQPVDHGTCFLTLSEPMKNLPFQHKSIAKMRQHFIDNLNVNGLGATIASPGELSTVLKGSEGGNYKYDTVQISAFSMMALHHLSQSYVGFLGDAGDGDIISPDLVHDLTTAYVEWVRRIQRTISFARDTRPGHHSIRNSMQIEPEWNLATALPYTKEHCAKQTSVPGLRAQALMMIANEAGASIDDIWDMIKFDLDWLVNISVVETETCDLWGATVGQNFLWNDVTAIFALLAGHQFALDRGDHVRAQAYKKSAEDSIGDPITGHLMTDTDVDGIIVSDCQIQEDPLQEDSHCRKNGQEVSSAVIMSLIHGRRSNLGAQGDLSFATEGRVLAFGSPLVTPTASVVARTLHKLNKEFCDSYLVNQLDTEAGVPGVLYGRYKKDDYLGGNAWVSSTSALASLLYHAAKFVAAGNPLDPQELLAWRNALGESFGGGPADFIAAGDSVLFRLSHHISRDHGHLYEQLDAMTGKQFNAKDLTWSYVETLMAIHERMEALEAIGRFAWTPPDPARWLHITALCLFTILLIAASVASFIWYNHRKGQTWSLFLPVSPNQKASGEASGKEHLMTRNMQAVPGPGALTV